MKTPHAHRNQRGSTTVEAAIVLSLMVTMISGGLLIMYLSYVRVWIDREVYEAGICLASTATVSNCAERTRRECSQALPVGEVRELRLNRDQQRAQVKLTFRLGGEQVLNANRTQSLPLNR